MNTVVQLENLLGLAKELGYEVRYESLGGAGGGVCALGTRKLMLLDVGQTTADHLETVKDALQQDAAFRNEMLAPPQRKAA